MKYSALCKSASLQTLPFVVHQNDFISKEEAGEQATSTKFTRLIWFLQKVTSSHLSAAEGCVCCIIYGSVKKKYLFLPWISTHICKAALNPTNHLLLLTFSAWPGPLFTDSTELLGHSLAILQRRVHHPPGGTCSVGQCVPIHCDILMQPKFWQKALALNCQPVCHASIEITGEVQSSTSGNLLYELSHVLSLEHFLKTGGQCSLHILKHNPNSSQIKFNSCIWGSDCAFVHWCSSLKSSRQTDKSQVLPHCHVILLEETYRMCRNLIQQVGPINSPNIAATILF